MKAKRNFDCSKTNIFLLKSSQTIVLQQLPSGKLIHETYYTEWVLLFPIAVSSKAAKNILLHFLCKQL